MTDQSPKRRKKMPAIPDKIQQRMMDRIAYGDEEFVARRVLRAAGLSGKKKAYEVMNLITFAGEDPTMYDLAEKLIAASSKDIDLAILQHSTSSITKAREDFEHNPYLGQRRNMLMLCRLPSGSSIALLSAEREWLLTLFKPPFTVSKDLGDGLVLFEQGIEELCTTLGVADIVEDILSGRLSL